MSSIETTELKLKTTPTGGVEASHSPYYRRLLSAGYKGFLQGTIGGAALYGTFGAIIGGLVALPLITTAGVAALALIPAGLGLGIYKGAGTFGNIGSTAAINAEAADLAEQRRYLLDRYNDLPDGPEGDREAEIIRQELLKRQRDVGKPAHMFHWKTVLVCALAGAAIVVGFSLPSAAPLMEHGLLHMIAEILAPVSTALAETGLGTASAPILGAAVGALAGATIGLDRYYVRKWFDHTQNIVHASSHNESAVRDRELLLAQLRQASREDQQTRDALLQTEGAQVGSGIMPSPPRAPQPRPTTETPKEEMKTVSALDAPQAADDVAQRPTRQVSSVRRNGLIDIQKAMDIPTLG